MSAAASFSSFPEFYTWGFSSAPIRIHLSLKVVAKIRKQIQDSEKTSGELAAQGILTGDTSTPGSTRVLDFKSLRTLDAASVEAAMGSVPGKVIGFYRTTPKGSTSMADADRALAASSFLHPSSVFLLIETEKSNIGEASFCFWGDTELFDLPMMQFPFEAGELAIRERRRWSAVVPEPSQSAYGGLTRATSAEDEKAGASSEVGPVTLSAPPDAQPVSTPAHRQESITPAPVAKPRLGFGTRWLPPALATVVVSLLVGAFLYFRGPSNLPAPAPSPAAVAVAEADVKTPLGLAVEKRSGNLVVSWNGNAPVISKANFGMLLIRGGELSRDIPLTAEELRTGSVVYASPLDQVRFQLNVVAGEQVARESVVVVMPPVPESRASLRSSQNANSRAGASPQRPVLRASVPVPVPETREVRQFKQLEKRDTAAATATPLRVEEPPPVTGASAAGASVGAPVIGAPLVIGGSLPLPIPPKVSATAPVEVQEGKNPQAEASLLSAEAHPPVATNQVIPALPGLLRGVLSRATVVDVNVSVDASGSVTKAEAVPKPGLNPLLRDAAVQAARRWKFQPAQFNGHPVPATIVVQFNFAAAR